MMNILPVVKRYTKIRRGKGFSKAELQEAGLSFYEALKRSIPIDKRRSTKHTENVKALKTYIKQIEPKSLSTAEKRKTSQPKVIKTIDPEAVKKFLKAVEDARSIVQ